MNLSSQSSVKSVFRRLMASSALSLTMLCGLISPAAALAPSSLDKLIEQHLPRAQMIGQGRMTYWGFKLYDAKLYASQEPQGGLALHLQYLRTFEASALYQQTMEELKKMGIPEPKLQEWSHQLSKAFKTVKEGDTITAITQPQSVTRLFHNGQPMSEISGEELSQAFLGIWLHPRTSAPQLRSSLLGQVCPTIQLKAYCHE